MGTWTHWYPAGVTCSSCLLLFSTYSLSAAGVPDSVLGNVRDQRLTNCRLPTEGPALPTSLSERWPSGFDLETKTYSIFKLTTERIMPSRSSWFAWGARPSRHTSTAPGSEWIVLRGPRRVLSAFWVGITQLRQIFFYYVLETKYYQKNKAKPHMLLNLD